MVRCTHLLRFAIAPFPISPFCIVIRGTRSQPDYWRVRNVGRAKRAELRDGAWDAPYSAPVDGDVSLMLGDSSFNDLPAG